MSNKNYIVFSLIAKLDKGNIESEAAQMVQGVTSAIENAFAALGQKIANSILAGGEAGIKGVQQAAQNATGTTPQGQAQVTNQPNLAPPVASASSFSPTPIAFQPIQAEAVAQTPAQAHMERAMGTASGPSGISNIPPSITSGPLSQIATNSLISGRDNLANQLASGFGIENLPANRIPQPRPRSYEQVDKNLSVFREAQIVNQLRSSGLETPKSEEQQKRFKAATAEIDQNLVKNDTFAKELGEKIVSLKLVIDENNKALLNLTGVEKSNMEAKVASTEMERGQAHVDLDSTKSATDALTLQKQAIAKAQGPEMPAMGMEMDLGRAAGPMGLLAAGLSFAGALPGMLRHSAAAGAEIENGESRDLIRGNVENALARERLGGTDALKSRAQGEEGLGVAGNLAAAVASALSSPVLGVGGFASAGYFGMKAVSGIAGFNQNVQGNIGSQIGDEQSKNFEYYNSAKIAREGAIGSFRTGQGIGSPELSGFLMGQSADPEVLRQRLAEERTKTFIPNHGNIGNDKFKATFSHNLTSEEEEQRQAMIERLPGDIERAESGRTKDGETLVDAGMRRGSLSIEQSQHTLASLAQGMGAGTFMNRDTGKLEAPKLERNADAISDLYRAQGMGFTQAPQVATALQQNGMDRGTAIETAAALYGDAVSASLEKSKIGDSLKFMASRAEEQGYGGAGSAVKEFQEALSLAQSVSGNKVGFEGPEMMQAQKQLAYYERRSHDATGTGAIGAVMAVQDWQKQHNVRLTKDDVIRFQHGTIDAPGLRRSMIENYHRKDYSVADSEREANDLALKKMQRIIQATRHNQGNMGNVVAEEDAGANTLTAKLEFQDRNKKILAGILPADTGETEGQKKRSDRSAGPTTTSGHFEKGHWIETKTQGTALDQIVQNVTGRDAANQQAAKDAKIVATGLTDLGGQLPALNKALQLLIDRAGAVLAGSSSSSKTAPFDWKHPISGGESNSTQVPTDPYGKTGGAHQ